MVAQQETVGTRRLSVGVIGVGVGGLEIIRAMVQQPEILNLMAGCDVVPVTLERFKERFPEARTYTDVNKLCEDKDLDAVYIASPNRFHAEHAITAARHGKRLNRGRLRIQVNGRENRMNEGAEATSTRSNASVDFDVLDHDRGRTVFLSALFRLPAGESGHGQDAQR